MKGANDFAPLLAKFFTGRLQQQRRASPHNVACYRDAFRLLVQYAQSGFSKPPAELQLTDLDPDSLATS